MTKKLVYLSTPIYYANGQPHFGHAYSTLYADFLANYYRQKGKAVVFVTGVDQHGQKILQTAAKANLPVQQFVDQITASFKSAWKELAISYDYFVETTKPDHHHFIQTQFQLLMKDDYLRLQKYQGWYCVGCETFIKISSNALICPTCASKLVKTNEWNYFFRVNEHQKQLIKTHLPIWANQLAKNNYFHDLKSFLNLADWDFSLSRQHLKWGIALNDPRNQIAYVWFDALFSYISVLPKSLQTKIWTSHQHAQIIHVLGKEISKFHLIYWPLLLQATNYRFPDTFLLHGWLLNQAQKMSKSQGNAWDFRPLVQKYGVDAFRLYMASLIYPGQDIALKSNGLAQFYQSQLVNNLSNYCHRVMKLVKQTNWTLPSQFKPVHFAKANGYFKTFETTFQTFELGQALQILLQFCRFANQTFDHNQPWKLIASSPQLQHLLTESLLFIANLPAFLTPFAPNLSKKINLWFNQKKVQFAWSAQKLKFFQVPSETVLFQKKL